MILTLRSHLVEAVRLRLRSDVPVGIYLSGGIDSSAIAGIAMHLLREKDPNAKLATFTLTFPGMHVIPLFLESDTDKLDAARDNDEGAIAARTAAFVGADAHMVKVTEVDLVHVLEDTIWHAEHPIFTFHSAGKFLLSKFVHDKGYKVVKYFPFTSKLH